jgi:hypothetical protein
MNLTLRTSRFSRKLLSGRERIFSIEKLFFRFADVEFSIFSIFSRQVHSRLIPDESDKLMRVRMGPASKQIKAEQQEKKSSKNNAHLNGTDE